MPRAKKTTDEPKKRTRKKTVPVRDLGEVDPYDRCKNCNAGVLVAGAVDYRAHTQGKAFTVTGVPGRTCDYCECTSIRSEIVMKITDWIKASGQASTSYAETL